ncbi:MAG: SpoIIE family protein phosphatase [Clostridia bacterium]|nr:SpoIIE family protein phosphatase [Clostridia bacterium]
MEKLKNRLVVIGLNKNMPMIKNILCHCAFFIMNILFGGISFAGGISPFATGFTAGAISRYMISSAAGAAVGYAFFFGLFDSLRFIAAITLIALVRLTIEERIKTSSLLFPVLLSASASFISSLAVFFAVGGDSTFIILCLSEALISGAFACFSRRVFAINALRKKGAYFAPTDTIATVFFGSILLLSVERFQIAGFSPARIAAYFIIMLFALCGREAASSIAGICSAVALGFDSSHPQLMLTYILTGLVSGLTGIYGKIPVALSLVATGTIALILKGDSATALTAITEIILSGFAFVFIPEKLLIKITEPLLPLSKDSFNEEKGRTLHFILKRSAKAVKDISASVSAVSELLQKTDKPSKDSVTEYVKEDICKGCAKYEFCWTKCRELTQKSFNRANDHLFTNERLISEELPERFAVICRMPDKITESFNRAYFEYLARLVTRQEVFDAKKAAARQFYSLGKILDDAAENLSRLPDSDPSAAMSLMPVFKDMGFQVAGISSYTESNGKSLLQVYCTHIPPMPDQDELLENIFEATGKLYLRPVADEYSKEGTVLSFCEEGRFSVEYNSFSHTGAGEAFCGDTCQCFFDGTGSFYAVLSDGMGSGSRAAVDSVMTCSLMSRLMRAGFSPESALDAVNCALLVKSGDETLSTLDILRIDLNTGEAVFYKAGASFSVIKKGEKTLIAEKSSMPLGILGDTAFETSRLSLSDGDIIFILSDGAAVIPHITFKELLNESKGCGTKKLAQEVVSKALGMSPSGKHDDITVICIRLTENRD